MNLLDKINSKTAKIGIQGGGYVGNPLAVEFCKSGFDVTIFELDQRKIEAINSGISYIPDVSSKDVKTLVDTGRLRATDKFAVLGDMDCVIIAVPTPLKKKDPDLQYIISACESIAKYLHSEMLISLESSTFPGTTDELILPMFQEKGYEVGRDFYLCYSPERIDPGNKQWNTKNIPKIIGGITPACTVMGERLYCHAINTVIPVQNTRIAEMVKLLENSYRFVNIGLVNELAVMCGKMNIAIWDVIDAAKTKPFGYAPFFPGVGVGGHCIPVDPFYFTWKAKQYGLESRFIELAGHVNSEMPHYAVQRIQDALNDGKKSIKGSRIHLMGMAYKKDIDDVRESPAVDVALLLMEKGAEITYYDPYVPIVKVNDTTLEVSKIPERDLTTADCVVILTDHSCVDYVEVLDKAKLIVDTRNVLKHLTDPRIVRL